MRENRNNFFKTCCVHKEGDKEPIKLPINMENIDILSISLDGGKLYQKSSFFVARPYYDLFSRMRGQDDGN